MATKARIRTGIRKRITTKHPAGRSVRTCSNVVVELVSTTRKVDADDAEGSCFLGSRRFGGGMDLDLAGTTAIEMSRSV